MLAGANRRHPTTGMNRQGANIRLRRGLTIGRHSHHRGARQAAHSFRINSGIEHDKNFFLPKTDWRPLTATELDLLVCPTTGRADIELLTLPNHLYRTFWSLDVAALTSQHGEPTEDDQYLQFAQQLTDFYRFIDPRIGARAVIQSEISAPGLRSTSPLDHTASSHGFRITDPKQCSVLANFGDEPRSFIGSNLPLNRMRQQLLKRNLQPPPGQQEQTVLGAFFKHCSDYPLLRLTLEPQEGVLIATQQVAFDGDTTSMRGPDIAIITTAASAAHHPNREARR